jgi:trafficking protein particle complex subunit 1
VGFIRIKELPSSPPRPEIRFSSPPADPAMQFFSGSSLTSVAPDVTPAPAAPPGTGTGANAQVLYVFNRNGVCLLYREWHRPLRTLDATQDHKLMFGLLYSLRSFTAKIDPTA